jgi:DNA-binding response OmpR family regulator
MMGILLVDPESTIRKFYAVNLKAPDRIIHEADTFHAAWHASLICHPYLIIMEVCDFADGRALEFLKRLADSPHSAQTPVLIVTTQVDELSAFSEMRNVRQILNKPITRHSLIAAVNAILGAPIGFGKLIAS